MVFSLRRGKKQDDVIVDRVTGAFNRRQLDQVVANGFEASDQATATLIVYVDDFDRYVNHRDTNADQVLERVSWVLMATVRTTDVVYRHDASSFCALLPATDEEAALAVADRIRVNVEKMPLLAESHVTVSVGVATGRSDDIASSITRAEAAVARRHEQPNQVMSDVGGVVSPGPVATGTAPPTPAQPLVSPDVSSGLVSSFSEPPPPPSAAADPSGGLAPPASSPLAPPSL